MKIDIYKAQRDFVGTAFYAVMDEQGRRDSMECLRLLGELLKQGGQPEGGTITSSLLGFIRRLEVKPIISPSVKMFLNALTACKTTSEVTNIMKHISEDKNISFESVSQVGGL